MEPLSKCYFSSPDKNDLLRVDYEKYPYLVESGYKEIIDEIRSKFSFLYLYCPFLYDGNVLVLFTLERSDDYDTTNDIWNIIQISEVTKSNDGDSTITLDNFDNNDSLITKREITKISKTDYEGLIDNILFLISKHQDYYFKDA